MSILFLALATSVIEPSLAGENKLRSRSEIRKAKERSTRSGRSSQAPQRRKTSRSLVAQAATGRVPDQMPEAPLDGSLVRGEIAQAGYLDGCPNGCGACCDCGLDVSCGVEDVFFDQPACGVEAGCGFEVGCGIGHAFERMGPDCGTEICGCGDAGCDGQCVGLGEAYCGVEPCGSSGCDACCDEVGKIPLFLPFLRVQWCRFDFFAGVQGFTGPMSFADIGAASPNVQGNTGSFGTYLGFNEGRSLKGWLGWDVAAQLGVRATQTDFYGSEITGETRSQIFVTGGFFRRVDYGLQYGVVVDYLNDDWWYRGNMIQGRGELSWKTMGCHSFGFQYMGSGGSDTSTTSVRDVNGNTIASSITFEPIDQYRLFYRRLLNSSGEWTTFAGWTDNDDGLLGTTLTLPLRSKWLLATSATFLIPQDNNAAFANRNEAWNISLGLIYRPGGPNGCGRYCRPMFDVADNGTFIVDRQ